MRLTKSVEEAAGLVSEKIKHLVEKKGTIVFAVPGGRSIVPLFKVLKQKNLPWEKVHFFMVDERLVDKEDPHSNFRTVHNLLFSALIKNHKMPESNLHPFNLTDEPDLGVSRYIQELQRYGGKFDIAVFGVGEDGHIGGLFPKQSVDADEDNYFIVKETPKPPNGRMTASRKLLLSSGLGVFLFIGEAKDEAFDFFKDKKISVSECPAKIAYEMDSVVLRVM